MFDLNYEHSPRLIRIKLPAEGSNFIVGTLETGRLTTASGEAYILKPLSKYQLAINPLASYDVYELKSGKKKLVITTQLPITISSLSKRPAIFIQDSWYRGEVSIQQSTLGIIAINALDVEQLTASIVGAGSKLNDSVEAIAAASVIARSYFYCLSLNDAKQAPASYNLSAEVLDYRGMAAEKDFVTRITRSTEGEVLVDKGGKLVCTSVRTGAVPGSKLFERIGSVNGAWERSLSREELEAELNTAGYVTRDIIAVTQQGEQNIQIESRSGVLRLSLAELQRILKLPGANFKVYSFAGRRGRAMLQFIGKLSDAEGVNVMGLVRSITQLSDFAGEYKQLLKNLYPEAYLSRF